MFNLSEKISELRSSILYLVFVAASLIIGLTWISIGLYSALKLWVGPTWSPFILAGIMLLPVIIFGLTKLFDDKPAKHEVNTLKSQSAADPSAAQLSQIIQAVSGQSAIVVTVVTVLAGIVATRFPSFLAMFAQVVVAFVDDMKLRPAKTTAEAPPRARRKTTQQSGD